MIAAFCLCSFHYRQRPWRMFLHLLCYRPDVVRSCTATSTYYIYPALTGKFTNYSGSMLGCLVILSHSIRQPGIWIAAYIAWCYLCQLFHIWTHLLSTQRTIQTNTYRLRMQYRDHESLERLPAQRTS